MRRFEESTGSSWSRAAAFWQLMCACAGCDLPVATSVVRSVQEIPCAAAAAGPWAGACHAQQNRLLVLLIMPYCLIIAWMWLPSLVFFLGFDSVLFLAETRLGRICLLYSWGAAASFLLFFLLAHSLFCRLSPKACAVPSFIE